MAIDTNRKELKDSELPFWLLKGDVIVSHLMNSDQLRFMNRGKPWPAPLDLAPVIERKRARGSYQAKDSMEVYWRNEVHWLLVEILRLREVLDETNGPERVEDSPVGPYNIREMAKMGETLCATILKSQGETGKNESFAETLERKIREADEVAELRSKCLENFTEIRKMRSDVAAAESLVRNNSTTYSPKHIMDLEISSQRATALEERNGKLETANARYAEEVAALRKRIAGMQADMAEIMAESDRMKAAARPVAVAERQSEGGDVPAALRHPGVENNETEKPPQKGRNSR